MKGAAGGVMGELTRARIALDERGQRLGELEEKTAGMMTSAEAFSKHAHEVNCLIWASLHSDSLKHSGPPRENPNRDATVSNPV